jgi:pimeloyl-ACP methyl ester carboxylesterase
MRFLLALLCAVPAFAEYAEVRGVRMYYEIHGAGRPVILLHGGMNSIRSSFEKQIQVFAKTHRVIAIEQMAHGHTPDVKGRKLTYESMAEDTAALLVKLNIKDADFVGWSDGGQLALRLAFTHPELVRRVVASGVGLGASTEMSKELNAEKDFGKMAASLFPAGYADYKRVSPDGPAHWSTYAEKGREMWTGASWGFTAKDLEKIQRPVLIVAGDADMTPLAETARIFRAIPKAKLYILPGTGHTTFQDRPEWLNPVVLHFLDQN